ncbi:hypothetical protein [Aeromonas rivipollensis]|uniref:hypothetical protein n=1 Tax=Aeromonas rivipollensis TaxID=948519 RepID=UPI0013D4EC75|nr:hypothetical protein [Aeromonas rivipollensis]NEX81750.1 hypothetical protein [Aeromonas rivipollensis]
MTNAKEILAYTEKNVTDDVAKAEAFIKLFFSKEQKPTYEDNPEQQLKVITVLAAAQKSIEANKLKEALEAVKVSIKPYKLLELYEIDSLKQHIHDEGIEVQALFSDEELATAGYVKKEETKEPEVETIKYLTRDGKVLTTVLHGKKQFLEKNGYSADVIEFWNWTQDPTVAPTLTRPKDLGEGTTVQKVSRDYLKEVSDEKLKELCKAYYTAA